MLHRLQDSKLQELLFFVFLTSSVLVALAVTALAWPLVRRLVLLASTSVLLAYLIAPLVELVRRRLVFGPGRQPLSRGLALLIIYVTIGGCALVAWRLATPRFERQMRNLSVEAHRTMHATMARVRALDQAWLGLGVPAPFDERVAAFTLGLAGQAESHADAVLQEANEHVPFLPWLGLAPVFAFFLIKDWKAFRQSAVRVLPEGHLRWRGEEFLRHVNTVLAGYTRAQLLSCLIIGAVCAAGFALLRVPYPLALGALGGVLEFLPVVGPLATALVAASLVSGPQLILLIGFLVGLRLVQDYVIYPRLTGLRMHLHPAAIVVAVLLGAKFGGLVGVFCAVPLVGVGAVMVRHYREYRDIQILIREHEREMAGPVASPTAGVALGDNADRSDVTSASSGDRGEHAMQ